MSNHVSPHYAKFALQIEYRLAVILLQLLLRAPFEFHIMNCNIKGTKPLDKSVEKNLYFLGMQKIQIEKELFDS